LFANSRFDTGMALFLAYIAEFANFCAARDPKFTQRYEISGDKINGVSIKTSLNPNKEWCVL
jgi:autophagy protein Apg6